MGELTRKDMLKRQELEIRKVDLGNDEFVFVREMSGRQRDAFEQSLMVEAADEKGEMKFKQSLADFRAKLVVNTACDSKGTPLFRPEDMETLSVNMGASRLDKIADAAKELNRISDADQKAMVKNSEGGPPEDSSSGSA